MTAVWPRAQDQGMALPLLMKPLPACSLPGAHRFRLVESLAGADDIKLDSIVQPYVPHDGIVHKVCVVGSQVRTNWHEPRNTTRHEHKDLVNLPSCTADIPR